MNKYIVEIVQKEHYTVVVGAENKIQAVSDAFNCTPWWTQLCDKRDFEVTVKEVAVKGVERDE